MLQREVDARNNPNGPRTTRNGTRFAERTAADTARTAATAAGGQDQVMDFLYDPPNGDTGGENIPRGGTPKFTIVQNLVGCNIDEERAKAVAHELFINEFTTCKNISETTLHYRFKGLAKRPVDPVYLSGRDESYIQAFIFWVSPTT